MTLIIEVSCKTTHSILGREGWGAPTVCAPRRGKRLEVRQEEEEEQQDKESHGKDFN